MSGLSIICIDNLCKCLYINHELTRNLYVCRLFGANRPYRCAFLTLSLIRNTEMEEIAMLKQNDSASSQDPRFDESRVIHAPTGSELTCKNWISEAAYRMIQNNL